MIFDPEGKFLAKKSTRFRQNVDKRVDNVDNCNYFFNMDSPIATISPAPIVISRSFS